MPNHLFSGNQLIWQTAHQTRVPPTTAYMQVLGDAPADPVPLASDHIVDIVTTLLP